MESDIKRLRTVYGRDTRDQPIICIFGHAQLVLGYAEREPGVGDM